MKNVLLFLMLAFGISWGSAAIQYFCGIEYGSGWSIALVAITIMSGPAVAAFILRKRFSHGPFFEYGWRFKRSSLSGWFMVPLIFVAFIMLTTAILALAGNVLHIEGFGTLRMDEKSVTESIHQLTAQSGKPSLPVPGLNGWVILITAVIGGIFGGVTINLIPCFGEEFGWRGALIFETRRMGFWKSNLFIGLVWGLWHAPLILQGHNYPGHPYSGVAMMMFFCTGLAFLLGYIRLKVRSVIACAAFHGMINGSASAIILLGHQQNPLYGVAGIAGGTAGIVLAIFLFMLDKETFRNSEQILSEKLPA